MSKCILLVILVLSIIQFINPVIADDLQVRAGTVTFEQRFSHHTLGSLDELVYTYRFFVDGSVTVQDNKGSLFYIPTPSFQPKGEVNIQLLSNSTHAIHSFNVKEGTLKLWVVYDLTNKQRVKIIYNGTTTDEDAEFEQEFENPKSAPLHETQTSMKFGAITYDWADLQGATDFEAYSNKLKVKFNSTFFLDPVIIADTPSSHATSYTFQRRACYANGHYWVFYLYMGMIKYASSPDGGTWSHYLVKSADYAEHFSMWTNNTHIHVAFWFDGLFYKSGTFGSNGMISWIDETHIELSNDGHPFIAVDSDFYPYIIYYGTFCLNVTKSQWNNGTWSTDGSYPQTLSTSESFFWLGSIVPLTDLKMYAVYSNSSTGDPAPLYGRLYNGSAWGNEETISSSNVESHLEHSVVSDGNDVHLVFQKDMVFNTVYMNRTYGTGWSSETVWTEQRYNPVISKASNGKGQFYIFTSKGKNIYWRFHNGSWSPEDWVVADTELVSSDSLTSYYENANDELGVLYTTGRGVYYVKFLTLGTLPEIDDPDWASSSSTDGTSSSELGQPKITIPAWGYWVIIGTLGLVGLGAVINHLTKPSRRHKGPRTHKTNRKPKNLKRKRTKTGRFQ